MRPTPISARQSPPCCGPVVARARRSTRLGDNPRHANLLDINHRAIVSAGGPCSRASRLSKLASGWLGVVAICLTLDVLHGAQVPASATGPRLVVEGPDSLAGLGIQLGRLNPSRLGGLMTLVGLSEPGPPIRVLLLPDNSSAASKIPEWVVGYASPDRHRVTLIPGRIGTYPFHSVETVLYHEVAHVLIDRAAHGARLPRWFNEGLASIAEPNWGLEDRTRLAWELLARGTLTATELEQLFLRDRSSVVRAYVLSHALLRDLRDRSGWSAPSRILTRVSHGEPFELAVFNVTHLTVEELFERFWNSPPVLERWIRLLGHPASLWGLITTLALVAVSRHRRRRAERRARWTREEEAEDRAWEEHQRHHRVH